MLSFEQLFTLGKKKNGMALTAGLPPMPPPRSLPSWKREGERGEKDRVHLSQVSDGRSGAQLTALLRARLACCVQDRQKRNDGKAQGTEGLFLLLCEQSYLENYPTHLLRTGAFCRLIRTNTHPLLHLSSVPQTLRNSSRFMHQCFPFNPPCWLPAVLSSSTKPRGVTVKWNKNKTDRKLTSWKLSFSREQLRTTGKHNASWLRSSDMRLFSITRKKENGRYAGYYSSSDRRALSSLWRRSPPLERTEPASWSNGLLK